MLHYRKLGGMMELLVECARERNPLRVEKYVIYPADWALIARYLDVAKKLNVQKYYLCSIMEHLRGDRIFADEGIRGAKVVELDFVSSLTRQLLFVNPNLSIVGVRF